MKNTIFFFLLLTSIAAIGQDPFIKFDKERYLPGDTLKIRCNIPEYKAAGIRYASLYLLIEDLETKKHWSYRYPIIDGAVTSSLVVDSAMKSGKYAFSFLVRKKFFSISGAIESGEQMELSYAMLTKNDVTLFDNVKTDENGSFSLKGLLFQDTCYFVFSPPPKAKLPGLKIEITTPLDSAFAGDLGYTQIVPVGSNTPPVTEAEKTYKAAASAFVANTTLPDVVVSATTKKKVELFDEEFSSGLFKSGRATVFDGLEENKIAQSGSIIDFLRGAVAGLRIIPSAGSFVLQWRGVSSMRAPTGSNVDVFVDEFQLTQITDNFISPSDIAMIKAYPPPAYLSPGGQRGAIAIYTKRGGYDNDNLFRNKFKIFGYSPPEVIWK